mmetsp:Transcript_75021/g.219643  ORF Transcript_75021/g.219643 Transcript_75021/m.219643 type:complete len:235 (-) Transcript_75021:466-1170(-)
MGRLSFGLRPANAMRLSAVAYTMSFCRPSGSRAVRRASAAVLQPRARRSIAARHEPSTRQGLPSAPCSRGAAARTCSMRCSLQKAFSDMSQGKSRRRPAECCSSSPSVVAALSRWAKSGQMFRTGLSSTTCLPETVGFESAASRHASRTPTPPSRRGITVVGVTQPPATLKRPAAARQSHSPAPPGAPWSTATCAPSRALASSKSCSFLRTRHSSSWQPPGAGSALVGPLQSAA